MAVKGLHAFVFGRVQGVGYRAFTKSNALRLKLKGFVRNLPDGRVEVYAEGEEENLKKLLELLKEGPFFARVDEIDYEFVEPWGKYETFTILY